MDKIMELISESIQLMKVATTCFINNDRPGWNKCIKDLREHIEKMSRESAEQIQNHPGCYGEMVKLLTEHDKILQEWKTNMTLAIDKMNDPFPMEESKIATS